MSVGSADVIVAIRDVIKKGKDKMGWEISEKHEVILSFQTTEKLLSFLESNEKELKNVEMNICDYRVLVSKTED